MITEPREATLGPDEHPEDAEDYLLVSEERRGSGEHAFVIRGSARNEGFPTDVELTFPSLDAALEAARDFAGKFGTPIIYLRQRG